MNSIWLYSCYRLKYWAGEVTHTFLRTQFFFNSFMTTSDISYGINRHPYHRRENVLGRVSLVHGKSQRFQFLRTFCNGMTGSDHCPQVTSCSTNFTHTLLNCILFCTWWGENGHYGILVLHSDRASLLPSMWLFCQWWSLSGYCCWLSTPLEKIQGTVLGNQLWHIPTTVWTWGARVGSSSLPASVPSVPISPHWQGWCSICHLKHTMDLSGSCKTQPASIPKALHTQFL